MLRLTFIWCGIAALSVAPLTHLQADELGARIHGTVRDPSGAPVAGAQVRAVNTETKVSTTIPTSDDGRFQFLSLPVGIYEVTVSKNGFRSFSELHLSLQLNQVYELPVNLEVGPVSETVQVEANPVQVETVVTQLGAVIDRQHILDLPLLNRRWVQLEQLVPGVMGQSERFNSSFATNGSQTQQNSFLFNGVDATDLRINTPAILPNPDALAEFNLITSTINPEYGRNSGAILNVIVQSGTNQFHGDAFEFYRDTFLTAHNFFQKTAPIFHQNQFGGTLGGPVWKNHTFFFLSYQGTRNRSPDSNANSNTTNVFTAAQRNGSFSDLATSNASSPFPLVAENGATYAAGTPYKILFPTGHIPTIDFNPISQQLLNKYVPLPNLGTNTYSLNPTQVGSEDQEIARIDHTFSDKDALWGTLFFDHAPTTHSLSFFGATLPGFGEVDTSSSKLFMAAWNHTFSPTALNELRLSYVRLNAQSVAPTNPILPSSLGFNITPQFSSNAGAPAISVTGLFSLGFSPYGPQPDINNTYQINDNFSKVIGTHTLKFGFDGIRYQVTNPYEYANSGLFNFGGAGTYSTGDPGADFLLGIPDSFTQNSGGFQDFRTYEAYLYVQDSWRTTKNLTLNYGVGYQLDSPLVNQHFNELDKNCFRPGQQSTIYPTAPAGLLFPGDQGCSASGYYNHYDHLAPRFGFAYAPDWSAVGGSSQSFVIRGGFGIYFNRTEEELGTQDLLDAPFSLNSVGAANPSFGNPYVDISTGKATPSPFPFTPPAPGQPVNFSQFYPLIINVVNPNFTDPYSMNFNLNIQRELPGALIFQAGYVGAQGRHLELVYEGNPISPSGEAACAADPACISSRANQHTVYPSHALYAPGNIFASVGTQSSRGVSSYNSFQASLNKRLSHGLTFLASYTWSHSIDLGSSYEDSGTSSSGISRAANPYNFALSRGDSSYDARHRFVVSYDYELPHLSPHWNNMFSRSVLDGWRLTGITTFQTGFPITVGDTGYRSLSCDHYVFYKCWDEPNVNGPVSIYDPRNAKLVNTTQNPNNTVAQSNYYFNPNAFSLEAFGTLGNAGRNNFHGPGINNTDLALIKEVRLSEARRIELRMESFNTFNHTQFRFSSNIVSFQNIASGSFGQVLTAAPGRIVQLGVKFYF